MINVLVVDDHMLVREGLKRVLSSAEGIQVAGEASTGEEALKKIGEPAESWGTVLLDISLPDKSGLDVLKTIKKENARIPVIMLTMHAEDQYALRTYRAGAGGYLTKESATTELVNAIRKVSEGGRYVSPTLAEKMVNLIDEDKDTAPHEKLSDREFQVFSFVSRGIPLSEIAKKLELSVKTVSTYRARLLTKMKMSTNFDLIQYATENDL